MRFRIEEQEKIAQYDYLSDPTVVIIGLAGAVLGFWLGGRYPTIMARIYGMGLGGTLGALGGALISQYRR